MRISFVIPAPSLAGGIKVVRRFGDGLVQRGHDVRVYYPSGKALPPVYRPRTFVRALRERLLDEDSSTQHFVGAHVELVPCAGTAVAEDVVDDADVLVATWWETREWIASWQARKGKPAYLVQAWEPDLSPQHAARVEATYSLPGALMSVSHFLMDELRTRCGRDDARFVGLGLDDSFDAPPRSRQRRPTVGLLVSGHPSKGTDTAFRALAQLEKSIPNLHVVAFGSERLQAKPPWPSSVEWVVRPPQDEIPKVHARCDVWLVSSRTEGFGLPGLEAAACRCPIVSTRCGGPAEYVKHGENGLFCDVDDVDGMARALASVLMQDDAAWKRMSDASHAIARMFTWSAAHERMERALLEAATG